MPRNQETTSVDQAPSTTSDPFGARATGPDDTAAMDDPTAADGTATDAGTGMDATAGADDPDRGFAGGKPVRGYGADGSVPPPEGEWVAGRKDSSATMASQPSQPSQPAADNTRGDLDADTTPAFGAPVTPARDADVSPATDTTPAVDADIDPAMTTPPAMDADVSPTAGTVPATGAHAAPTTATPGSTDAGVGLDAAGAAFVTNADGYRASWVRIQSGFVDDPHGSVTEAADLVAQITGTLVSAVQERERSLRGGWDDSNADTENLRNALRDYRAFFERLMKV